MFQSLFGRLLAIFMAVIIAVVFIGAAFSVLAIRNNMIEYRMENLMVQAREIAFLASRIDDTLLTEYLDVDTPTTAYLQWKAQSVYEDYGAYILVVDRNGRIMDNMVFTVKNNPDTVQSLSAADVAGTLREVLTGKEVRTQIINAAKGTIFTVAVPWTQNDTVLGAVFIHTSAQVIEAEYRGVMVQIFFGFSLAFFLAFMAAVFYSRAIVRPLTVITQSAEAMSRGKFSQRANVTGVDEVRQLAGAFNVMAEKLEQVEESRREFVANVSHELRSPVTSIHGFVEGMLDGTIPQEEHKKYLQIVGDETNRLKRLIADLLLLSRMDKGVDRLEISDYDINESIRRVLIGRMNDIEAMKLNVHLQFEQEPCMVRADKDRITQVLYNLVDNALKFVSDKGNLTITTKMVHDIVSVTVTNDGSSILEADRPRIFDRFYKADKAHTSGKGTGLGLSICKQIMEMHGQTIRLLPGDEGASFLFTLPAGTKVPRAEAPRLEEQ